MLCLEWAWCHIPCTPPTQFRNMHTRLMLLPWDTPEARHSHRTHEAFLSFLRHILPLLLPRLHLLHFLESEFLHVTHHIPRRPVSFLIPRGTYTFYPQLAFHLLHFHLILIYRGGSASQLVISGRKGFRVAFFFFFFFHGFLSLLLLSWHSPTFSFSLHLFGVFI